MEKVKKYIEKCVNVNVELGVNVGNVNVMHVKKQDKREKEKNNIYLFHNAEKTDTQKDNEEKKTHMVTESKQKND